MKCQRCGVALPGGRGAYRWRSEVVAMGEDALYPSGGSEDADQARERLLARLAVMSEQEIEADVYQLWEGMICRCCRFELGRIMGMYLGNGRGE
ncbi:MAG: hypothetical protein C4524_04505 [Candidatus Zixiibacteriota bacterium]|nr:MAG: hypothetical protein C4524_04505 [candidate division Zixibacteria bacterium]